MQRPGYFSYCYLLLLVLLSGCVQPYAPDVILQPNNYLVVDGFINMRGATTIRLTRSRNLQEDGRIPVEAKASIYIEQEGGNRYPVPETATAGTYTSAALSLGPDKRVRLFIRTAGQHEYASDFIVGKLTPAIDAVTWDIDPEGVQLYLDTHDAANQSRYYRWEFQETWKFTGAYQSFWMWTPTAIVWRTEDIFNCWATAPSTAVTIGNTVKLTEDVVAKYPLTSLAKNSVKLRFRYSNLVKQYAITAEEYAYWEALSKNTESIGSMYDALPTQLTGNLHSLTDAEEVVLGFVGAQSMTQRRIYINRSELPDKWVFDTGYDCGLGTYPPEGATFPPNPLQFFGNGLFTPVEHEDRSPIYTYSYTDCVDCRKRGTNVKPDFWVD